VIHQGRLVADDAVDALAARATGGAVRVRFTGPRGDLDALDGVAGVAAAGDEDEAAFVVRPRGGVEALEHTLARLAAESAAPDRVYCLTTHSFGVDRPPADD